MNYKKIVLVIVEGESEADALEFALAQLCRFNQVVFQIIHSDITTERGNTSQTIRAAVGNRVKQYLRNYHFKKTILQEIIHLVDMDGAYVPDENIVADASAVKPFYTPSEIRSQNPKGIACRNAQKRDNLNVLCATPRLLDSIPYRVFYMSSNLDHVLYGKQNNNPDQKCSDAHRFSMKYKDDLEGFKTFFCDSDFSVKMDYPESWDYIKQELHSLERHTNFGICIEQLANNQ